VRKTRYGRVGGGESGMASFQTLRTRRSVADVSAPRVRCGLPRCFRGEFGPGRAGFRRFGFRRFVFQRFGRRDAGVRAERGQAWRGETRMKAGPYSGRRGMRGKLPQGYVFSASAPVFVGEFVIFAKNKA